MKPIRVAMILPGLGRVQRGAETAFLEVAMGLNAFADIDVTLFGSSNDVPEGLPMRAVECTPRENFESYPKFPTFRSECHYEEFSFMERLWRSGEFDAKDFDVTISCTYPWVNWLLRFSKRRNPNLKNLFVTQNGDWMCRAEHREYQFFKSDGVIAINPEYFENNREKHQTVLIPNGTDPDQFHPRSERSSPEEHPLELDEPFPKDKPIILMVSALIESKRVAEGVRAAAKVDDAFFVVAGDGPERENIRQLAEELMPGRYRMLGSVERTQMPALFRSADIFLHMSQIEPFGIVYLEAAASGLAVVTHDGETPRWILGDTAVYADSNDSQKVADAIAFALEPAQLETLGTAARERVVADWTWKAQAAKYREFIMEQVGAERADSLVNNTTGETDAVDHHRKLQHS